LRFSVGQTLPAQRDHPARPDIWNGSDNLQRPRPCNSSAMRSWTTSKLFMPVCSTTPLMCAPRPKPAHSTRWSALNAVWRGRPAWTIPATRRTVSQLQCCDQLLACRHADSPRHLAPLLPDNPAGSKQRWPQPFGQSSEIFKWNVRGSHAANLIAGSVAKYASSGVRSSRLE